MNFGYILLMGTVLWLNVLPAAFFFTLPARGRAPTSSDPVNEGTKLLAPS